MHQHCAQYITIRTACGSQILGFSIVNVKLVTMRLFHVRVKHTWQNVLYITYMLVKNGASTFCLLYYYRDGVWKSDLRGFYSKYTRTCRLAHFSPYMCECTVMYTIGSIWPNFFNRPNGPIWYLKGTLIHNLRVFSEFWRLRWNYAAQNF